MKPQKPGRQPPKAAAPTPLNCRKSLAVKPNPKLADQTRKRLGQHYASKYQTMRRG